MQSLSPPNLRLDTHAVASAHEAYESSASFSYTPSTGQQLWDEAGDVVVITHDGARSIPVARLTSTLLQRQLCGPLLAKAEQGDLSTEIHLFPRDLSTQHFPDFEFQIKSLLSWICDKPLDGTYLAESLQTLLAQMNIQRDYGTDNIEEIFAYADRMGYTSIQNNPDHALAMLNFAELIRHRLVWIDSFAHCVGMADRLANSKQYKALSMATKTRIVEASTHMEARMDKVFTALGTFLEEEISSRHLGLGEVTQSYLESFRSVLHTYHVAAHGYWPPIGPEAYLRNRYSSMHQDFGELYELLADHESSEATQSWNSINGGICVLQHIENFNTRHHLVPLPCSSPLLPQTQLSNSRNASQKSLRNFWPASKEHKSVRVDRIRGKLLGAINKEDRSILANPLVQHYLAFEADAAAEYEDRISPVEARKICWILIYALLQTLASIVRIPAEVRTTPAVDYPLCIDTRNIVPWEESTLAVSVIPCEESLNIRNNVQPEDRAHETPSEPVFSIEPDCHRDDYFESKDKASNNITRSVSLRNDSLESDSGGSETSGEPSLPHLAISATPPSRRGTLRGILRAPSIPVRRNGTQSSRDAASSPRRRRRLTWSDEPKRGSPLAIVDPLGGFDHMPEPYSATESCPNETQWPLSDNPIPPPQMSWPLLDQSDLTPAPVQPLAHRSAPREAPICTLPLDPTHLARSDSDSAPSLTWSYRSHDTSETSEHDLSVNIPAIATRPWRTSHITQEPTINDTKDIDGPSGRPALDLSGSNTLGDSRNNWRDSTTSSLISSSSFKYSLPSYDKPKTLKIMQGPYTPTQTATTSLSRQYNTQATASPKQTKFSIDVTNPRAVPVSTESNSSSSNASGCTTPLPSPGAGVVEQCQCDSNGKGRILDRGVAVSLDGRVDESTVGMYRSLSVR